MPSYNKASLLCFAQPAVLNSQDDDTKVYDGDIVAAAYIRYAKGRQDADDFEVSSLCLPTV